FCSGNRQIDHPFQRQITDGGKAPSAQDSARRSHPASRPYKRQRGEDEADDARFPLEPRDRPIHGMKERVGSRNAQASWCGGGWAMAEALKTFLMPAHTPSAKPSSKPKRCH